MIRIEPKERNIAMLFSSNRFYHVDFYQRKYKWSKIVVEQFLEDLFFKFDLKYKSFLEKNKEITMELISSEFSWYYLNTYVTSEENGRLFVVDGQHN